MTILDALPFEQKIYPHFREFRSGMVCQKSWQMGKVEFHMVKTNHYHYHCQWMLAAWTLLVVEGFDRGEWEVWATQTDLQGWETKGSSHWFVNGFCLTLSNRERYHAVHRQVYSLLIASPSVWHDRHALVVIGSPTSFDECEQWREFVKSNIDIDPPHAQEQMQGEKTCAERYSDPGWLSCSVAKQKWDWKLPQFVSRRRKYHSSSMFCRGIRRYKTDGEAVQNLLSSPFNRFLPSSVRDGNPTNLVLSACNSNVCPNIYNALTTTTIRNILIIEQHIHTLTLTLSPLTLWHLTITLSFALEFLCIHKWSSAGVFRVAGCGVCDGINLNLLSSG